MSAQNEKPIIFNGDSIRAILDERKTQTRRVIKPQPTDGGLDWIETTEGFAAWQDSSLNLDEHSEDGGPCQRVCPYGKVGDVLYLRETWCPDIKGIPCDWPVLKCKEKGCTIIYKADDNEPSLTGMWRPSIFMPKWAARIWLEITGVRVERVQSISEKDAEQEGCQTEDVRCHDLMGSGNWENFPLYKAGFITLWDSINKKRGFGWEVNPWVWVIEFKRKQ